MKALVKPESKQYFKRFEQPVEDVQTTMNNIEFKKIAKFVGIDPN